MARRELLFGGTRRALGLALLTGVGAALSACGQRGPLYLPDPKDPTKKRS